MPIRKITNVKSINEPEADSHYNNKQEWKIKKNKYWISILVVFLIWTWIGYIFTIKNNSNDLELSENKNKHAEKVREKNIKENNDYFEVQLKKWETETISLSDLSDTIQQVDNSNKPFDINVPQFPINNNWLVYNSSKWGFILKFPSTNISYSINSTDENFGRNDINCSRVINVIKYSEKENLEISPAVKIYECEWNVLESWSPEIIIYPKVDKKFIVRIYDGAWYDFSANLIFEKLNDNTIDVIQ